MTKVLHLCNDFLGSRVYLHLYQRLNALGYSQTVFVPLRKSTLGRKGQIESNKLPYDIIYSSQLKYFHRLLFGLKKRKLKADLIAQIDVKSFDLLHATTLFSDGSIAYELYRVFRIPYIVTVRSTDIGAFFKYRPDLLPYAIKILKSAKQIIFISHALKGQFFKNTYISKHGSAINEKCVVIPNGIDSFWLENQQRKINSKPSRFLYIGTLIRRKNVIALSEAILYLKPRYPDISLTIVGGGGKDVDRVEELANEQPSTVTYLGIIQDKKQLLEILRSHDIFAMPSYNETFGLVYIEALSQGLPILYSRNEGVDGFISNNAGYRVNARSKQSIIDGVETMLKQHHSFDVSKFNLQLFDWDNIANCYREIYERTLN